MTANTKSKLRPLADRVLVQRKKVEEQISGGIILPDSAQSKQDTGIVIAVGPSKKDKDGNTIECPVKVGDQIMWDRYAEKKITMDEEEFIIVKSGDIIAIVE
ncbi:MAG: 10 kDa chaperonin 2 [Chlamydiia bacterium]|nr:10 kDa chaperonin 2 [Chlamydiia bacterium]MCH9617979.1 10 kDa chaperonin 2 [Chlamydiia bacterium]MCH9623696.1 10 kDa chaperonin 2 [Chlamydiia bacterium]